MGDPATPTPADRAATLDLAERIVQAVIDDEVMPLGVALSYQDERDAVESLVFSLAQELVQTRRELEEACDMADRLLNEYSAVSDQHDPGIQQSISWGDKRIAELRGKGRMP